MVGRSPEHLRVLEQLAKVAPTQTEVLITGPTGVGKERYARYLHERSHQRGLFVAINCGALPSELLENELFGHVSGAFTGARPTSEGLVASAEAGTLFLDEVDSLALASQVKLLRFIQEREYRRLGESRMRRADVRIVAATNGDLLEAVRKGAFRSDLYFRLRVVPVRVPPLRERPADILPLLRAFTEHYARAYRLSAVEYSPRTMKWFHEYSWPGNARELENVVRYLTALQLDRPVEPGDVDLLDPESGPQDELPGIRLDLSFQRAKRDLIDHFERRYITEALRRHRGNISQAARASGKARRAFFELMRKHGIHGGDAR
ncbi:sigma 54-interacting transcriptional regulator [Corallococcus sp. EGB]|uniref:sigma 54-interacting transcriptional regulator n=1 Tax=Corallococcus sp. EGB TaxID=1521117 RepID=UPI001CC0A68E|nr:sigma-54 dependent transcriptional regulator [Corallococcus sp. EGB]